MSSSKQDLRLRKYWDRWLSVVRSVEGQRRSRVSGRSYSAIYRELLNACEFKSSEDDVESSYSKLLQSKIRKLVEPWMSVETLCHTDRRILRNVLDQAQEVDSMMHPHAMHIPRPFAYLLMIVVIAVCAFGLVSFTSGEEVVKETAVGVFEKLYQRVKLFGSRMSLSHWLGLVAVIVLMFGVSMTLGTRRS